MDYATLHAAEEMYAKKMEQIMDLHDSLLTSAVVQNSRHAAYHRWCREKISSKARAKAAKTTLRVVFVSVWFKHAPCRLPDSLTPENMDIALFPDFESFADAFQGETGDNGFDIFICCSNSFHNECKSKVDILSVNNPQALFVLWAVDNHHMYAENVRYGAFFDVIIPAHETRTDYLHLLAHHVLGTVPCGVWQWPATDLERLFQKYATCPRKDALYGGFSAYPQFVQRNTLVAECIRQLPSHALTQVPMPGGNNPFFSLSAEDRFAEFSGYKVGLQVAARNDVTSRIFDSLVTGQIPIIQTCLNGLNRIIPTEAQMRLPVIWILENTPQGVKRAWEQALEAFDKDGMEGIRRRHEYAMQQHLLQNRIWEILQQIKIFLSAAK